MQEMQHDILHTSRMVMHNQRHWFIAHLPQHTVALRSLRAREKGHFPITFPCVYTCALNSAFGRILNISIFMYLCDLFLHLCNAFSYVFIVCIVDYIHVYIESCVCVYVFLLLLCFIDVLFCSSFLMYWCIYAFI